MWNSIFYCKLWTTNSWLVKHTCRAQVSRLPISQPDIWRFLICCNILSYIWKMGMCAQEACLSFALKWYFHAANSSVFPICLLLSVWGNYLLPRFNLPWLNFCSQLFFVTFLCDIKFRLEVLLSAKRYFYWDWKNYALKFVWNCAWS